MTRHPPYTSSESVLLSPPHAPATKTSVIAWCGWVVWFLSVLDRLALCVFLILCVFLDLFGFGIGVFFGGLVVFLVFPCFVFVCACLWSFVCSHMFSLVWLIGSDWQY